MRRGAARRGAVQDETHSRGLKRVEMINPRKEDLPVELACDFLGRRRRGRRGDQGEGEVD